jgi:hypothetical protein
VGYVFLSSGTLLILAVLLKWVSVDLNFLTTGVGLIAIWIGVLLLQTGKTYFSVVSSLILLLSLIGFSDNLLFDVGQPSNRDPKFVIHGLFCLAWMIAFAIQADLIRTGRRGLHMKIGIAGFIAAVGFTISTIHLFYVLWIPWGEMLDRVQINRILMPSFVALIVLAWIYRGRPEYHKRMIFMGTLYLLLPILDRATGGFVPLWVVLWNGFFVSLFVYDWVVAKKISPITFLGSAWFYLAWTVVKLS